MDTHMKSYGNLSGGETKIGLAKGVPHSIPWFETSFSQVAHGNRLRPIPFPFLTHNKRIRHTWMALERKGFQTFPSQPALSWRTPCHGRVRIKFSTCSWRSMRPFWTLHTFNKQCYFTRTDANGPSKKLRRRRSGFHELHNPRGRFLGSDHCMMTA